MTDAGPIDKLARGVRNVLGAVLGAVLRVVFVLAGLLFMAGALLFALVVFALLLLWALLRGRSVATVRVRMPQRPAWQAAQGRARRQAPQGEVVDAEVREVPGPLNPTAAPTPPDRRP